MAGSAARILWQALVEIITGALLEWVARHSDWFINQENLTDILRQALDEFISRHKDEFL